MFIINNFSTCFGHHYAHLQETKTVCYCTWCAALVLLDVVGSGCGALRCRLRALWRYNIAPHNRYQPHPAEPAQHIMCSNTRLVLLKMGIMVPETRWESIDNKHLTVASCCFLSHFTISVRVTQQRCQLLILNSVGVRLVEWYWLENTKGIERTPVSITLHPPQIPHSISWN